MAMMWIQKTIVLKQKQKGFHLITNELLSQLPEIKQFKVGMLHLFIKHTSAGLTVNENADPSVRTDLHECIQRLIPDNQEYFEHILEGADDMPAHIKSSLIGHQTTLPINGGKLKMGIWQGIYLGEFRNQGGDREVEVTIYGDTLNGL